MFKKLAAIGFAASIGFAPIGLAPMAAMAQAPARLVVTKAVKPKIVVRPANWKQADCSKEADAKGLHAKPRKKFIAECKKN